jgi:predicted GNAT family N-acyltransferase
MSDELEIRHFNIREADWPTDGKQLSNIRRLVFIVEQKVSKEEEWDGKDGDSWHWLATDEKDVPIGTARLLADGQIGRMAVLSDYRKFGVGAALLEQAVEKARHLGFERAYLHAQSHALGFYERAGFVAEGEEFDEAGIPHYMMTRALSLPEDNIQRLLPVAPELDMAVKAFDTAEVLWKENESTIRRIRRQIFVTELDITGFVDEDETDRTAIHWLASNDNDHIIGIIRMTPTGEISQFGVVDDYRRQGVGTSLLELAVQRARRFSLPKVSMDYTAAAAVPFLEKSGFESNTESETEAESFVHLIEVEDRSVTLRDNAGKAHDEDLTYRLGEDKQLILLRRESEFRNIILEMAGQARRSIRFYSPFLTHNLLDTTELMTICSRLARRNKYTKIEILVFDPHRIIKNGHALLNLARKLPSSVGIKVVDPEMRQQNHEFILVDGAGFIYRPETDTFEGNACFSDITENNRLGRQFTASWESGLLDANLRQLRI